MRLLAFSGQRLAALNQYAACQQVLQAEFGVEPEAATTALYRAIETERLTPPTYRSTNNKPPSTQVNWDAIHPSTPLYGRAEEQTRLHHWLTDPQHRLVGLFGLTGQGKSALATEVVTQLAEAANQATVNPFEIIFWSALTTCRTLPQLLHEWLIQLARPAVASPVHPPAYRYDQKEILPLSTSDESQETVEALLQQLLTQLRRRRVLLVVDSGEMIYGATGPLTDYQPGWSAFDELLRRLADNEHRSCLLLISRMTPVAWETLERRSSAVRTLSLVGLSVDASVALLQAGGRTWPSPPLRVLAEQCGGNKCLTPEHWWRTWRRSAPYSVSTGSCRAVPAPPYSLRRWSDALWSKRRRICPHRKATRWRSRRLMKGDNVACTARCAWKRNGHAGWKVQKRIKPR